jgi:hypothetical protein
MGLVSSAPAEVTVAVASSDPVVAAIARLEGKVDVALALHGADIRELRSDSADHEARIRSLERKVWIAAGFAAAVGGVIGNLAPSLLK